MIATMMMMVMSSSTSTAIGIAAALLPVRCGPSSPRLPPARRLRGHPMIGVGAWTPRSSPCAARGGSGDGGDDSLFIYPKIAQTGDAVEIDYRLVGEDGKVRR